MPAVLAQVHGDTVGAGFLGVQGGLHRVRIGCPGPGAGWRRDRCSRRAEFEWLQSRGDSLRFMNSSRLTSGRPPRWGASAWRIRRLAAARAPGRSSRRRPWITVRSPGTARVAAAPPAPGRPLAKAGTTPAARSGAHRCRHRERNHSPVAPAGAIRTRAAAVRWGAPPQQRQGRGVVGEDFRLRVFRRQQADQQLVEIETAEQRLAIEQVGNAGAFQAGHGLQFAAPAPLRFQRHEWPRQGRRPCRRRRAGPRAGDPAG